MKFIKLTIIINNDKDILKKKEQIKHFEIRM